MTISAVQNSRKLTQCVCLSEVTASFGSYCFFQHMVVCSRMSEERFLNSFEIDGLLRSAQNVNTQKATSLWLDAVTSFRQEKNLDISFGTCSNTELDQFLCRFYTSLRPKKPGVAVQPQLLFIWRGQPFNDTFAF